MRSRNSCKSESIQYDKKGQVCITLLARKTLPQAQASKKAIGLGHSAYHLRILMLIPDMPRSTTVRSTQSQHMQMIRWENRPPPPHLLPTIRQGKLQNSAFPKLPTLISHFRAGNQPPKRRLNSREITCMLTFHPIGAIFYLSCCMRVMLRLTRSVVPHARP